MSTPTFLIVDDDAMIRLLLRRTLARYDPHAVVVAAATVAAAQQHLWEAPPDSVITDYHLTDGTGLEILAAAQRCAAPPQVIVISGDIARAEAVLAAGARAFLAKPFTPTDLLDLLRRLR